MSVSPLLARSSLVAGQLHEGYDASFIMVKYGANNLTMLNTDCAIQHSLLHLKEKYLEDGWDLPDDVLTTVPSDTECAKGLYTCLDLLDDSAVPLDFCNKEPLSRVKKFVTNRATYTLCKVKRTESGIIKEAIPLISKPSTELLIRLGQVLRAIERAKRRGGTKGHKLSMDIRKRRGSIVDSNKSNRSFASVVRHIRNTN